MGKNNQGGFFPDDQGVPVQTNPSRTPAPTEVVDLGGGNQGEFFGDGDGPANVNPNTVNIPYFTGVRLSGDDLIFSRNNAGSLSVDLGSVLIDPNFDIDRLSINGRVITLDWEKNGVEESASITLPDDVDPNTVVDSATMTAGVIAFKHGNSTLFSLNINPLIAGLPTEDTNNYITSGTISGQNLVISRQGLDDISIDISSLQNTLFADLTDVTWDNRQAGYILYYNNTTQKMDFKAEATSKYVSSGAYDSDNDRIRLTLTDNTTVDIDITDLITRLSDTIPDFPDSLNDLTDVTISSPTNLNFFYYANDQWVNADIVDIFESFTSDKKRQVREALNITGGSNPHQGVSVSISGVNELEETTIGQETFTVTLTGGTFVRLDNVTTNQGSVSVSNNVITLTLTSPGAQKPSIRIGYTAVYTVSGVQHSENLTKTITVADNWYAGLRATNPINTNQLTDQGVFKVNDTYTFNNTGSDTQNAYIAVPTDRVSNTEVKTGIGIIEYTSVGTEGDHTFLELASVESGTTLVITLSKV